MESLTPHRLELLLSHFTGAAEVWRAPTGLLKKIPGIPAEVISEIVARRNMSDPVKDLDGLLKRGIRVIFKGDAEYPVLLNYIFDPPAVLYVRGEMDPAEVRTVAVVGARKATAYGLSVAEKLGNQLAEEGFWVISGMARGIDSAAHRGALAGSGKTVAVLGCGLDVVYPRENRQLMEEIAGSGAVISEFAPNSPPEGWHFPRRNRVISGLARGVVVVEAEERSGSLITVDFALEQGREVFAVPGPVTGKLSRGPHKLIKMGAKLVENAGDILEELGAAPVTPQKDDKLAHSLKELDNVEKQIYGLLSFEAVQQEELFQKANLSGNEVITALLNLEIKGLVRQLPGQRYVLTGY